MIYEIDPEPVDYLIVGHTTLDTVGKKSRLGGTAAFGALTARRLGLNVGLVTAAPSEVDLSRLEDISIQRLPASESTVFENRYTPTGRQQRLTGRADLISWDDVPLSWQKAEIIHLAPVAQEVPISLIKNLPPVNLGCTLQGWMRCWDDQGSIRACPPPAFPPLPGGQAAAVLSVEDLGEYPTELDRIQQAFPIVILTLGPEGALLIQEGRKFKLPAIPNQEKDPTGAGDILAAAFFCYYFRYKLPALRAAELAVRLASDSITRTGLCSVPKQSFFNQLEKVQ